MFEHRLPKLPPHLHASLVAFLRQRGDLRHPQIVLELAVQAWMDGVARDEAKTRVLRGYQWKSLFLPEHTRARMHYRGRTYIATVHGDTLVYEGRAMSPRQFVMHVTGTVRNAWRELWINCPGEPRWHLADTRRRLLRRGPPPPPNAARRSDPLPPVDDADPLCEQRLEWSEAERQRQARYQRPRIYRDDIVRDDQPNWNFASVHPGRAGPGERRLTPARAAPS